MPKYAIGIDFGSLSGRALLVDVKTGAEIASAVYEYPHAIMDCMPNGGQLEPDWAIQHPADYLGVLSHAVPAVLKQSGVCPDDIIGIGTDFTASTVLPVKSDGMPVCFLDEFKNEPHAYAKLWKHHAAKDFAEKINQIAAKRGENWLWRYGGKISSELMLPKLWQVAFEAPKIYEAADDFIEASDWIVWRLSGNKTRNACAAGYKAFWNGGYPADFFAALDGRLEGVLDKLGGPVAEMGKMAGRLTAEMAAVTGLRAGTPVAAGNIDAHACVPAAGIGQAGQMLAILGTSACYMLMSREEKAVPGILGVVKNGILPGYFGYEAGQSCMGDHFAWFIENLLPESYVKEAERADKNIHKFLREKAAVRRPGEGGLLALDWWNGNRSVLCDAGLRGVVLGLTLKTRPEDIYRALLEAVAFGARTIVENFRENGVAVDWFCASGGISQKDPLLMQIYADVLGMPVHIASSTCGSALGSAIYGAAAAGVENGGYADVALAAQKMGRVKDEVYQLNRENAAVYDRLYAEYKILHDYFGRGQNDVMKRLQDIRKSATQKGI